jgi:hypothetical protein
MRCREPARRRGGPAPGVSDRLLTACRKERRAGRDSAAPGTPSSTHPPAVTAERLKKQEAKTPSPRGGGAVSEEGGRAVGERQAVLKAGGSLW